MRDSINILVIEDNESDYILAIRNIEKSDFVISSRRIQTAEELREALDKENWDIIVSDYSMPSFDAPSALKMLLDSGKEIPFIVVSGTITEETAIGLMRLGAADYLMKDRLTRLGPLVRREINISRVRKEREESLFALKQSQNWFNLVYNATSDLMFLLLVENGKTFRYQNVNSAYLNFFGKKFDDLVGKKVDDVDLPDVKTFNIERYSEALTKRKPINYETRLNLSGREFILKTSLSPIFDQNRKCTHLLGASQDNTELKNAEALLKENEERFRLIIERSNSMFYRQDIESGRMEYVSPKSVEVLGFPAEEVIKWEMDRQISRFYPEDLPGLASFMDDLVAADSQGSSHIEREYRFLDSKGNYRWIHGDYSLLRGEDNSPKTIIGSLNDITREKEAEIALKNDELYLRNILQATQDGFWLVDTKGSLLEANRAYCEMSGYSQDELITMKVNDIDSVEEPHETVERINRIIHTGRETFETRHRKKDGSEFDVEMSTTYLPDKEIFICFSHDISDRKQAQAALEQRIMALTMPQNNQDAIDFKGLFDVESIQRLQDDFSNATGVASIITYPDGTPITRPSNFCRLCSEIIRRNEKGRLNCFKSDAVLGRFNPDGPVLQPCLSGGLWDAGAAIMAGGHHVANWLIGQVRDEKMDESDIRLYARSIGVDENKSVEAFNEVPSMSLEEFEKIARALFTMASQLSTIAFQNIQQARSIAEQKKVEDELRRWENIFQSAEWGISIGSADGKTLELVNNTYARMHGYTADELIGFPIEKLYAPEFRDAVADSIRIAHELGHHTWEARHIRKNGQSFPVLVDLTTIRDNAGHVKYRVVNVQDISERKRVEESLKLSEEKFSTAFHVSPDSININRLVDGMYIEINQGFTDLTGYTKEDVQGKTSLELDIWDNPEDRKRLVQGLREKGYVINLEAPFRCKNGDVITCWMSAKVIEINGEKCLLSITRDITDYRRVQKSIEENDDRQSIMIANISDVMAIIAPDGTIKYKSPNIGKWFGWLPEDLIGTDGWKTVHPEDLDRVKKEFMLLLENENEYKTIEYRYLCKDGSYKWIELTATNLIGNPLINGILTNYHDISDRIQMQTALLENEARFRALFEKNPDGVVILDPENGKIIDFNDIAHRQLGYSREEFARMTVADLDVNESAAEVISHIKRIIEAGSSEFETLHRTKNGEIRNVRIIAQVIQLRNNPIFHCIWRDITPAKRTEDELKLNTERVQALLQLHQMADRPLQEITDFALETAVRLTQSKIGYLAFMNDDETVLTMHSWSKEAMKDYAISDKHVEHKVKDSGLWGETVRQRKAIITNDISAPHPNKKGFPEGHAMVFRHLGVPVIVDRKIVLVVGVGNKPVDYNQIDIDQVALLMEGMWLILNRMKSGADLKRYRENLEELVDERTAELSAINQELEAFSYSVSHDLRAPLRALNGFSTLLLTDYQEKLDKEGVHYLNQIHGASQKMETLINDLLNLSHITRTEFSRNQVNLSSLADDIARNLLEESPQRKISFEIAPDIIVHGDENLLKIVLENLFNNASKFTYLREKALIQFGVHNEGADRVYFVKDNGAGFDMKLSDRLFTPFQRLHGTQEFAGIGIGLSIVQRIINRHGGHIWAEGAVDRGATFFFTLPGLKKAEKMEDQRVQSLDL